MGHVIGFGRRARETYPKSSRSGGSMGPTGPGGPSGSDGPTGPGGDASTVPGPTGPGGSDGLDGSEGPTGPDGAPGPSGLTAPHLFTSNLGSIVAPSTLLCTTVAVVFTVDTLVRVQCRVNVNNEPGLVAQPLFLQVLATPAAGPPIVIDDAIDEFIATQARKCLVTAGSETFVPAGTWTFSASLQADDIGTPCVADTTVPGAPPNEVPGAVLLVQWSDA